MKIWSDYYYMVLLNISNHALGRAEKEKRKRVRASGTENSSARVLCGGKGAR